MARPDGFLLQRDGAIATLTLDRERRGNALDSLLVTGLSRAVGELSAASAPPVRALLLAAVGSDFSVGADLEELCGMTPAAARAFAEAGQELCRRLENAPFPVIAAARGLALGAGFELLLACDLVLAADDARLGLPEIRLGILPGFGGTQRLVRRVGLPLARELCYSGRQLGAQRARSLGLVARVVAPTELAARAQIEAEAIAARAPLAIRAIKRVTGAGVELDLEAGCALEARAFAELFATRDANEGTRAFLEDRDPEFTGE